MKPLKVTRGIARWILRIVLGIILFYKHLYTVSMFNLTDYHFYISMFTLIASSMLIIGGFLKSSSVTVISSLVILGILILEFFLIGAFIPTNTSYLKVMQFAVAFYFVSFGNTK
jgi:hypothetical protein